MYYFNARYYDPAIGRFITEDPVKDGGNWYLYCRNNPLRYVDSDGETAVPIPGSIPGAELVIFNSEYRQNADNISDQIYKSISKTRNKVNKASLDLLAEYLSFQIKQHNWIEEKIGNVSKFANGSKQKYDTTQVSQFAKDGKNKYNQQGPKPPKESFGPPPTLSTEKELPKWLKIVKAVLELLDNYSDEIGNKIYK